MAEPWIAPLEAGDPEAAWDLFIERYRRLIFAAIRHYTAEPDEVMDVFAQVCEALREGDFARLRRCAAHVDPDLPHRLRDLGMNAGSRLRPGGDRAGLGGIGEGVEERFRHLRAAGVVDAREEHRGHAGCRAR